MRRLSVVFLMILFTLSLAACSGRAAPSPTAEPTATLAAPPAIVTSTPGSGSLLVILPTARVVDSLDAVIQAGTNVRMGPGMLFDVTGTYSGEQQVKVTGQEPGGNWFYVENPQGLSGWANMHFLTLSDDQVELAVKEPSGELVIRGHIYTPNGNPANGLGVSLLEPDSPNSAQLDSAFSNQAGEWYLYLPLEMAGKWTVRADSYGCDSNAVNSDCNLIGHFPDPQDVTLPLPAGTWIDFTLLS